MGIETVKANKRILGLRPAHFVFALLVVLAVGVGLYSFLGRSRQRQTLLDVTIQQLEENVRASPQAVAPRLAVATAYAARGFHSDAIEQFQEALKMEPTNQQALIGLGTAQMNKGDLNAAAEAFLQVADLNKDNPVRFTILELEAVYYNLGSIYLKRKDPAKAAEFLQDALKINRTDSDAWFMLGTAREKMGDLEGAEQGYAEATRFVPNYLEAYERLMALYKKVNSDALYFYAKGMAAFSERRYAESIEDLKKAVSLRQDLAVAHQGLGMAYEAMGRGDEARQSYQAALDRDPDLLSAQLGLRRLTPPGATR